MSFDIKKMNKLPPEARFFDVNNLWYFSNRWAVRLLCPLPVSANQVTFLSLVSGLLAGFFFISGSSYALVGGACFLYGKIFLDNVDGNLARVRGEVSRLGRFFDSLTDFLVTVWVYAAITWRLVEAGEASSMILLGAVAGLSSLLHCSYFVFYLVSYTSVVGSYDQNRVDETVTPEDRRARETGESSRGVLLLQQIHVWIYGWQDRLMETLDRAGRTVAALPETPEARRAWCSDKAHLTLASPLCICTNNMVLVVCALLDRLEAGLVVVAVLGNIYLLGVQTWKTARFKSRDFKRAENCNSIEV